MKNNRKSIIKGLINDFIDLIDFKLCVIYMDSYILITYTEAGWATGLSNDDVMTI